VLALFVVSDMVTGYYLTFNFQVSHISPGVDFPDKDAGCVALRCATPRRPGIC
jgi:hypothetical protein